MRFCGGNGTTQRVPSFDGVPLDADVTLPATGKGPFPLIVMLHGLDGSKHDFESTSDDGGIDNVTFASKGWAVLTYTARGFGNSCGTTASRKNTPACDKGWIHLADQRYEIHDTQYLAAMLVDEGLVQPSIAVTGLSYGGGQTLELAMLKNRIRLTNGKFVPWVSPVHDVPMSVGAAYAMWGWDDLVTSLEPNGAVLTNGYTKAADDIAPGGVEKQSWDTLLYNATTLYYLSPPGVDPTADLTDWYKASQAGEPYTAKDESYLTQIQTYHSAIGIPMPSGGPAPTVMQNGWTDTLFPVSEALHWATRYAADHVSAPLLQIFDDYGHGWAQGKSADVAEQTADAEAFLDDVMITHTTPKTGVIAIGTTCPASKPSTPTLTASSWKRLLSRYPVASITSKPGQTVTSKGGFPSVAAHLNPAYHSPLCQNLPGAHEPGTADYTLIKPVSTPTHVLGPLRISATLHITGQYPELIGRLWDVSKSGKTRQLVEAGDFRPAVLQSPGTPKNGSATTTATFELAPNLWTLRDGHSLELELVGSTAPWFRPSNGTFSIRVSHLIASINAS